MLGLAEHGAVAGALRDGDGDTRAQVRHLVAHELHEQDLRVDHRRPRPEDALPGIDRAVEVEIDLRGERAEADGLGRVGIEAP
jgi:hypothetical protein